jgi:hypothetical protein
VIDQSAIALLTIPEAAEVAEVAPSTMRCWITRYGIPTVNLDGLVLVTERDVLECERVRRHAGRGRRRTAA